VCLSSIGIFSYLSLVFLLRFSPSITSIFGDKNGLASTPTTSNVLPIFFDTSAFLLHTLGVGYEKKFGPNLRSGYAKVEHAWFYENYFFDIKNFTMTQVKYLNAPSGS